MESLIPLMSFAFVTSVTPGPNNILLTASGIRFGLRRSLPHIVGIQFGVAIQLALCAFGIGLVLLNTPILFWCIRALGTGYLLYLAWSLRVNIVAKDSETNDQERPFTFWQAALFQFVNPKAWMMTVTAGSLFVPELSTRMSSIIVLCAVFAMVGGPSSGSWAVLGAAIKNYLAEPFWQRCFSTLMIILTIYTAIAIWFV